MNDLTIAATTAPTMTSREIADLVEARHDNVKRTVERLVERGTISQPPMEDGPKSANGVVEKHYLIGKRDSYVIVAQLSPEFTARLVDRWQELEAQQAAPSIPRNLPEALRLAADLAEQKALAESQRDNAVATKAEIGCRREATAMNTASQAIKKAARLETELDRSMQYATVKRMEMLYHGQKFEWRLLKATAAEMSLPPVDVYDVNYGTVKAYHANVWRETYALEILAAGHASPSVFAEGAAQ